jgi:hypothetical protein
MKQSSGATMSEEFCRAQRLGQKARQSTVPTSPRAHKPVMFVNGSGSRIVPDIKLPTNRPPPEDDEDEDIPDYSAGTPRSNLDLIRNQLAKIREEEHEQQQQSAEPPSDAEEYTLPDTLPTITVPPPPLTLALKVKDQRITMMVAKLPPPPVAVVKSATVVSPRDTTLLSGETLQRATQTGDAVVKRPTGGSSGGGSSSAGDRISSGESLPGTLEDSNNSIGAAKSPRRPRLVSIAQQADQDSTTVADQLTSLLLLTSNRLCRRGWCCWLSGAPCNGPAKDLPAAPPIGTLSRKSSAAAIMQSSSKFGPGATKIAYQHRDEEVLHWDDPELQMEYVASIAFLQGCFPVNSNPRRSDALVPFLDTYVKSGLNAHPRWPQGGAPLKLSKENKALKELLEAREKKGKSLRVSHAAVILAGIYLQVIKLDQLLSESHVETWADVYMCEDDLYTKMMSSSSAAAAPTTPKKGSVLTKIGKIFASSNKES